ncbi:peptidoglycan-associated lipoprotein Pal [Sphingomonas sp. HDW15A]|uniref:peptidoglycan-associated lipoprotein Pal n=1 Tax=Sphingomonas sp. HDW15A TaxID=2714942 RepID=UPI00140E06D3|nr:peptidoglycan-associated lipoprotein Pal [Sphingomonas sp. HDW15A]QIK95211.1 peptidoglycan-associated lipoprotein Pal [Sphingomonas sp. HDW15A]
MRKHLILATAALALMTTACAKKTPPPEALPPAGEQGPVPPGVDPADVELTELPAMQADLVAKAGSDTVYFGTDEYNLDSSAQATLTAQARWMQANPNVRASIEGHADERGTREYNMALGERRANAARDFLVSQGVPADRLLVTSWGKERPVAPGSDEPAWAQNRRVVTVVVR